MNTKFIECEKGEEYGAITGKQTGSRRRFFLVFMGRVKDFLHCKSNKKSKRLKKEGREAEHRATVCNVKGNIFTECKREYMEQTEEYQDTDRDGRQAKDVEKMRKFPQRSGLNPVQGEDRSMYVQTSNMLGKLGYVKHHEGCCGKEKYQCMGRLTVWLGKKKKSKNMIVRSTVTEKSERK